MNYVNIEQRLVESIYITYDDNVSDTLLSIWNLTRKTDWVVLLTDHKKNVKDLFKRIGTDERAVLTRLTSAIMLRVPEILDDRFIDLLCESIRWSIRSLSNIEEYNQNLSIDPETAFGESPDLVVMYMLSNINSTRLSIT